MADASPESPAEEQRFAEVYALLHRRAQALMGSDRACTLQPTALVHEAWIKVTAARPDLLSQRDDFLAYAGRAMRNVLIDSLRRRKRRLSIPLHEAPPGEITALVESTFSEGLVDLLALHDALNELESFDPNMARAIELLYFAGLDVASVARMVGMSKRSFERDLTSTRAWIFRRLS